MSPEACASFAAKTVHPIASPLDGSHKALRNLPLNPRSLADCPITCIKPQEIERATSSVARESERRDVARAERGFVADRGACPRRIPARRWRRPGLGRARAATRWYGRGRPDWGTVTYGWEVSAEMILVAALARDDNEKTKAKHPKKDGRLRAIFFLVIRSLADNNEITKRVGENGESRRIHSWALSNFALKEDSQREACGCRSAAALGEVSD